MQRRPTTRASRLASITTCLMAGVLAGLALRSEGLGGGSLLTVVAALSAVAGVKMWFHNCFESHLLVVLMASAVALVVTLQMTIGLPGSPYGADAGPLQWLMLLLTATVGTLLVVDTRIRRRPVRTQDTYAR